MLCKESATQKVVGNVTSFSNLKTGADHVTTNIDHVQVSDGLSISKAKPKWSRILHMEYGPTTEESTNPLAQLHKRRAPTDNRDEDFYNKPVKQHKPKVGAVLRHENDEESARVDGHPC